jgi:hypothetical protein
VLSSSTTETWAGTEAEEEEEEKRCAFLRRSPALIEFGHALKSTTDM